MVYNGGIPRVYIGWYNGGIPRVYIGWYMPPLVGMTGVHRVVYASHGGYPSWYTSLYVPLLVLFLAYTTYTPWIYTTLVHPAILHYPGYTLHTHYPARQRVYIPVAGTVAGESALGSERRNSLGRRSLSVLKS